MNNKSGVLKLGSKKIILELCPRCKSEYLSPKAIENSLSRKDNKTLICSNCGTAEALEDMFGNLK